MSRQLIVLTLIGPLALEACVAEDTPDGAREFAENCASCHGATGQGNGPLAAGLNPPPANLTTLSARNGGTFPYDRVMGTIDGFHRGERIASAMPEFGAGDLGPTVIVEFEPGVGTPVPSRLLALTEYLLTIQEE